MLVAVVEVFIIRVLQHLLVAQVVAATGIQVLRNQQLGQPIQVVAAVALDGCLVLRMQVEMVALG
jgi:hypothetical protein